jgi:NAD(P)-dependent dehydrogenase (short-subunit alcohol dehydrogenase family)
MEFTMSEAPILLITGASRGIGAATAKLAAGRGFDVAVNYLRDETAANAVVGVVRQAGRRAIAVQGDMGKEADIARMFATVDKDLGRLTHLVYNAGITGKGSRVEAADPAMMRNVIDVNVLGALLCVRAAIPRISRKHGGKGGAMVLISSVAATLGGSGEYVWYAATKGAIDSMTLGLSKELAADGIRVNAVAPGPVDTAMAKAVHSPAIRADYHDAIPLGRYGLEEELAEAIFFLSSERAAYITGQTLAVDGGFDAIGIGLPTFRKDQGV